MTALALAWENRTIVLALAVALLVWAFTLEHRRADGLEAALAAKPRVEVKSEKTENTKIVQGPVRIVEHYSVVPGKCEPIVTERIIEAAPRVETKVVEVEKSHADVPNCPAPYQTKRWIVGADVDAFDPRNAQTIRGGVTLFDRVDLTIGHSVVGPGKTTIGAGVRF